MSQADEYSAPVGDQVMGVLGRFQEKLHTPSGPSSSTPPSSEVPTIQHAAGKFALDGVKCMNAEDDLTETLSWYGSMMEEIGGARLRLSREIQLKARRPLRNVLDALFEQASSARKAAARAKSNLNSIKRADDRSDNAQRLAEAEKRYSTAVQDATHCMKSAIESPVLTVALKDMLDVQRQYFSQCLQILDGSNS